MTRIKYMERGGRVYYVYKRGNRFVYNESNPLLQGTPPCPGDNAKG